MIMVSRASLYTSDNQKCSIKNSLSSFLVYTNSPRILLFVLDGGFRSKKRRTSENVEIEDRLESLILRVGEKVITESKITFTTKANSASKQI